MLPSTNSEVPDWLCTATGRRLDDETLRSSRGFPVVGEPQRVEGPHTVENEITSMEWDSTDIYYSNNGAGPLMARILYATNDTVHMERWHLTGQARRRFELPISYFLSPRCGWKLRKERTTK